MRFSDIVFVGLHPIQDGLTSGFRMAEGDRNPNTPPTTTQVPLYTCGWSLAALDVRVERFWNDWPEARRMKVTISHWDRKEESFWIWREDSRKWYWFDHTKHFVRLGRQDGLFEGGVRIVLEAHGEPGQRLRRPLPTYKALFHYNRWGGYGMCTPEKRYACLYRPPFMTGPNLHKDWIPFGGASRLEPSLSSKRARPSEEYTDEVSRKTRIASTPIVRAPSVSIYCDRQAGRYPEVSRSPTSEKKRLTPDHPNRSLAAPCFDIDDYLETIVGPARPVLSSSRQMDPNGSPVDGEVRKPTQIALASASSAIQALAQRNEAIRAEIEKLKREQEEERLVAEREEEERVRIELQEQEKLRLERQELERVRVEREERKALLAQQETLRKELESLRAAREVRQKRQHSVVGQGASSFDVAAGSKESGSSPSKQQLSEATPALPELSLPSQIKQRGTPSEPGNFGPPVSDALKSLSHRKPGQRTPSPCPVVHVAHRRGFSSPSSAYDSQPIAKGPRIKLELVLPIGSSFTPDGPSDTRLHHSDSGIDLRPNIAAPSSASAATSREMATSPARGETKLVGAVGPFGSPSGTKLVVQPNLASSSMPPGEDPRQRPAKRPSEPDIPVQELQNMHVKKQKVAHDLACEDAVAASPLKVNPQKLVCCTPSKDGNGLDLS